MSKSTFTVVSGLVTANSGLIEAKSDLNKVDSGRIKKSTSKSSLRSSTQAQSSHVGGLSSISETLLRHAKELKNLGLALKAQEQDSGYEL